MQLKHILRRLWRAPLFTVLTVLTITVGIGANTAIFSVLEGVLLKPLAYPRSADLVAVDHDAPGLNLKHAGMAPFLYFIYRDQSRVFERVGIWSFDTVTVTGLAEPEQVAALDVTEGVLPTLGVQPLLGRLFTPKDDTPNRPETVVLTFGYWQSKFGGNPSVIGRRLLVDGRAREVIGVLPRSFRFLDEKPMMFFPLQLDRNHTFVGNFSYQGVARLRQGTTIASAMADLKRLIPVAIHTFPPFPGYNMAMFEHVRLTPKVRPLKDDLIGDIGTVLWVLMGTIAIVLLIACANVANLLLVRADGRQQELAIRAALGAGWRRIARELLIESLLLSFCGGLLGLPFAYAALRLLVALGPANLPRLAEVSINGPVLFFTLCISLIAGLLFGSIPIVKYAGPHLGTTLRAGGRSLSQSKERHRARSMLVVVQITLALVLLISSGLMIRTFFALRQVQPGFTAPAELETMRISVPEGHLKDPVAVIRLEQNILERIEAVPGVSAAGISTVVPMSGQGNWHDMIFPEGRAQQEGQMPPLRSFKFVSPGLFKTMGTQLVVGRDFTWSDVYGKRPVALVSENMARELWRSPSAAIGKRIRESLKAPWREIIGVVADERDDGVNQKAPTIAIWPLLMNNFSGDPVSVRRDVNYLIRSQRAGNSNFAGDIRKAVWSVDPSLPVANVRTMQEVYSHSLARTSFTLVMLALAGGMALLLGVIGIYGVISYSVSQRTRELGIRMALGAGRSDLVRMFMVHAARLALLGVACGLVASIAVMRLMSSLLFAVKPVDPLTYAGVSLGLVAAALLASYVPALRVTGVDPSNALRAE
ncbi:MAG TPA: ABC transporter permease [Bryobacteraceae bacterium]|jgi:predicted permease|nr:ABC transporter permease [Bryobacteraceae bacterium]